MGRRSAAQNHQIQAHNSDTEEEPYPLCYSSTPRTKPLEVTITMNNVETSMEIDTGATLPVMSEATYTSHSGKPMTAHLFKPPLLDSQPTRVSVFLC